MNYYSISQLINFFALMFLALFVLFYDYRNRINQTYALVNCSMAFWVLFYVFWLTSADYNIAFIYLKILMMFAATVPVTLLHFVFNFLNINKYRNIILPMTYCLAIICIYFIWRNLLFDVMKPKMFFRYWPDAGRYFNFYVSYFYYGVLTSFYLLMRAYFKANGQEKNRLQYFIFGSLLAVIGGSLSFPLWYNISIPPCLNLLISVYAVIAAYAILKHHLMDINVVLRKGIIFTVFAAFMALLYFILARYSNLLVVGGIVQPPLKIAYTIFAFFAFILHGLLGCIVFFNNPRKAVNRLFSALSLAISFWILWCFIESLTANIKFALLADLLLNKAAVFAPALFLHTFYEVLNIKNNKTIILGYLFSFALFVFTFTSMFSQGVSYSFGARYLTVPGKLYVLFPLITFAASSLSLFALIKERNKSSGYRRIQLDYLLFAGSMIIAAVFFYFLLVYKIIYTPFDNVLNIVYGVVMAYAMLKHRLMDITIVIRKGLMYSFLIGSFTGLYLAILYIFSSLLGGLGSRTSVYFSAILIVIFAISFQPLRDKIQDFIDKVFFRGKYDYQKTLKELSLVARSIAGLDELLDKILTAIVSVIKLNNASIYVQDKRGGRYFVRKSIGMDIKRASLSENDNIIKQLSSRKEAVMYDETTKISQDISVFMKEVDATIVFPIIAKNELEGFLCLGEKLSGEVYSDEDIDLLTTLCSQMAVSIENAMLYEDALEAQKKLYQADKLATVGALAAGLAHEIKNPIAAIKGFAQVIDRAVIEKDSEAIKDFKEVVPRQLDRINEIVEKLLTLSRPPKLEKKKIDINSLLDEIVKLVEKQALKQRVEIVRSFEELPKTLADPEQLTQAFLNLVLNAVQSMPDGGQIEIRTRFLGMDRIIVEIIDNGAGIPKDRISRIFDPFYTTKDTGSGLGLSVTQKIIIDHHGKIEVESEVGKGSKFTIMIPVVE